MSKSNRDFLKRKASSVPSIFEGLSALKTVREATNSHSSSSSSSDSPLPDLIIEKEANRHDEPKEFYDDLHKRLLKLYRKLFLPKSIEGSDDVTSDCNESMESTSPISTNNFLERELLNLTEDKRLSSIETSSEYTTSSETEKSWYEYHDIISTSVMIHREEIDDNNSNKQFVAERGEINALAETGVNEAMEYTAFSSESDSEVEEESDEQIELMRGATKTQFLSSGPSIDTIMNTIESTNIDTTPRSISLASEGRRKSHADYILASSQSHMRMSTEIADDFQGVFHSTPHTNNETTYSTSGFKRSSTSNESSLCPEKRSKYLDTGTQTSQENRSHNINWETLRNNLFIGTPKIYRACSCTDHACES